MNYFMNYKEMANSGIVFLICGIPIILCVVQSIIYIRMGVKETKALGMNQTNVKKAITNSAIFSILPSLPIVVSVAALMPALGKYVPWLRLSVIGSVAYETACADMTMKGLGYSGMGDTSMTQAAFVSVVFVMCIVSVVWPLANVIGLKFYDKKLKKAQAKPGGFMKVAAGAMFIGLMCVVFVPRTVNAADPVGIVTCLVAGVAVLLIEKVAKALKIKVLADFSFPIAMILGMITAIISTNILK
jgi:hypothetical protein